MNSVFGLDIGTRNVVGTVGYQNDDKEFVVAAQYVREHETRAMLDGQIHDIGRVAKTIKEVKDELEKQTGQPLEEVCIAAAGRVLKTVTTHVEYEYAQESVVTGEDIHTLNLLGIEKAQEALKEVNDTSYKFYCVGYSTVKFFLNDEVFISLEGHKANKIGEDIIVTFLPEDVVDGLYAAVGQAGLSVANMTLEPIAAINVAIPENYRMLNIALVDVGAGTSDISITRDGSIIAYGMIPHAGDELTEVIVQHFLVDFNMAESIKLQSTTSDKVTYKDIMSIEHTIPAEDVWEVVAPVVENIAQEVSAKIRELNGDKTVSACFVVGGGGKIHGFTERLAEGLDLPQERVALRGEEVLGEVIFEQEDIKKDPLLVTPIGICLNYYDQRNNFIMVRFNGERIKLYDNNRLTIVDAALQAGFPNDELFPKRGTPINFTVNGVARLVRGEAGEGAVVTMNGKPASINTPLEPNSEIVIEPSTAGEAAVYKISQLDEYNHSVITFVINGRRVSCPRFVQVNGRLEPEDYSIKENDVIETRNYYTVRQIAQFMDLVIDTDQMIYVNNEEADLDTLVYENFSVEWKTDEYGVARIDNNTYNDTQESDTDDALVTAEHDENADSVHEKADADTNDTSALAEPDADSKESDNTVSRTSEQMMNQVLDELHDDFAKEAEASAVPENKLSENELPENELPKNDIQEEILNEEIQEEDSSENTITVIVNGEPVELSGKDTYIFVDIFTHISFDLQAGKGRAIATVINGRDAQFSEELHEGDQIELYWKEN